MGIFLFAGSAEAAISITSVEGIDPSTELTVWTLDARDPNDAFGPSSALVRVTFTDVGCATTNPEDDYYVTMKVKAQDSTEYTLVNFAKNGEAGEYDPMYALSVTEDTACSFIADYEWNPSESQALGYYDIYAYVFEDETDFATDSYVTNFDELELTTDGAPGFPPDVPALGALLVSVDPVDRADGGSGADDQTTISIPFTDLDDPPTSDFYVEIKLRHPDNETVTTIASGGDGSSATRGADTGDLTITGSGGNFTITFTDWNPETGAAYYDEGPYDISVYVRDAEFLSDESTYTTNADAVTLTDGGGGWGNAAPSWLADADTDVFAASTTVIPGNTVVLTADFDDTDDTTPITGTFKLRAQDNSTEYTCTAVVAPNAGAYQATCTWDTTGADLGWYDIYFKALDNLGDGIVAEFTDNLDEFRVGASVTIDDVEVTDELSAYNDFAYLDIQPDDPDFPDTLTSTTIKTCFTDTDGTADVISDYYVTVNIRKPDNSSIIELVPNVQSGNYGMTIVAGTGANGCTVSQYRIEVTWTPSALLSVNPEGLYDILVSVYDSGEGVPGNTDTSDYTANDDMMMLVEDPTMPPNPYELNESPTPSSVIGGFACVGGLCTPGFTEVGYVDFDFHDLDDEGVGEYTVTMTIRSPDGASEYVIFTDQGNGGTTCDGTYATSCGVVITSKGDGVYTVSIEYDPLDSFFDAAKRGYYDVKVVVVDGLGAGGESGFDENNEAFGITDQDFPPIPTEPPDITAVWATPMSVQLESGSTTLYATFTDDDNETVTTYYSVTFKVRGPSDTVTDTSCTPMITNPSNNNFSVSCPWTPGDTLQTGFYDLSFSVTDDAGTPGDTSDDVTVVDGHDENENELELTPAANLAPNAPTSLAEYGYFVGETLLTPFAAHYTNEPSVKLKASMSDQNAIDDIFLEVEVEPVGTAFDGDDGVWGSDDPSIMCWASLLENYETPTAVTGEVQCDIAADGEYHWRARVVDVGGLESADWLGTENVAYGTDPDDVNEVDFIVDTAAPTVSYTVPTSGGNGGKSNDITIVFDYGLAPLDCTGTSVWNTADSDASVYLREKISTNWVAAVIGSCSDNQVVLNPTPTLTDGLVYTVYITTDVSDKAGNTMVAYEWDFTARTFETTTGAAAAVWASNVSIDVSMPYTDDFDTDSTYTVDYKLSTAGGWTNWITGAANTASPYLTTIPALTEGETYDVRMTYNDPDGVLSTNPQTVFGVALPTWSTIVGAASASPVSSTSLDLTMPYTGDDDTDNTYKVEYKLATAGGWTTLVDPAPHSASPYTTTILSLMGGAIYDVRATWNDLDGVSGTNPQTITGIDLPGDPATTVGAATATAPTNSTIDVSMPYTFDTNTNNTYTVDYKLSTAGGWTNWITGAANAASPYTTTITGLAEGESYEVQTTWNDPEGVTGTNPQTITGIVVPYYSTTVGVGAAAVATNTSIDVSMPYTDDANTTGSYTVEYRDGGGWNTWITAAPYTASPYTTTITGLIEGGTYEVQMTWIDATDTVTGSNPQIVTGLAMPYWTTATGAASSVVASNTSIDVTMPYTNDVNTNNNYTVDYKLDTAGGWTNWVTGAANTATPFTTTITGLTEGESYSVRYTWNDAEGVTGANPQSTAGLALPIWSTATGVGTAAIFGTAAIDVTMPYTNDINTDNSYTVDYKLSTVGGWTNFVTNDTHSASPYTTRVTGLVPGETYDIQMTWVDSDGVTGTNPQSLTGFALPSDITVAGAGTAVANGYTQIDVTMPYTGDNNTTSSYTVEYRLCCAGWTTLVTEAAYQASPYTTSITSLIEGSTYEVRMTWVDSVDGISGTNPLTVTGIVLPSRLTTVGVGTAVDSSNTQIDIAMPYTDDDNNNNNYTVDYKLSSAGGWTNHVASAAHTTSPYTDTINGLVSGETYDVRLTWNDINGTTGTNPQFVNNIFMPTLDASAPDTQTDVTVARNYATGLLLKWTAPYDDAGSTTSGKATYYDMRYVGAIDYPSALTTTTTWETNWESTTFWGGKPLRRAAGEPRPGKGGVNQVAFLSCEEPFTLLDGNSGGDIGTTDSDINVLSTLDFDSPTSLNIEGEIITGCLGGGVESTQFTNCVRGQGGTTAAVHVDGKAVGGVELAGTGSYIGYCLSASGPDERVMPNTIYYTSVKSKDERDSDTFCEAASQNCSGASNVPQFSGVSNASHTGMFYGWNAISLPYDASTAAAGKTLALMFGDDTKGDAYLYSYIGTDNYSKITSDTDVNTLTNGQGYLIRSFGYLNVIDEMEGSTVLVAENASANVTVTLSSGMNLVGNPYLKNIDASDKAQVRICDSAACSGTEGTEWYSFPNAAAAGWVEGLIYYGSFNDMSSETCDGGSCTAAKFRPWWGQWVSNTSGSTKYIRFIKP